MQFTTGSFLPVQWRLPCESISFSLLLHRLGALRDAINCIFLYCSYQNIFFFSMRLLFFQSSLILLRAISAFLLMNKWQSVQLYITVQIFKIESRKETKIFSSDDLLQRECGCFFCSTESHSIWLLELFFSFVFFLFIDRKIGLCWPAPMITESKYIRLKIVCGNAWSRSLRIDLTFVECDSCGSVDCLTRRASASNKANNRLTVPFSGFVVCFNSQRPDKAETKTRNNV